MKTVKPFVTDSPIVSKQGKVVPCQLKHSSPTEILGRVIDPQNPSFTREAAQSALELQFPPRDVTRMNELAEKARSASLLDLMHSKARISLKKTTSERNG